MGKGEGVAYDISTKTSLFEKLSIISVALFSQTWIHGTIPAHSILTPYLPWLPRTTHTSFQTPFFKLGQPYSRATAVIKQRYCKYLVD